MKNESEIYGYKNHREQVMKHVKLNAGFTVEMSVIAPMIMIIIYLSVMAIFYEHDKNIMAATAYETAVVGSTKSRLKDGAKEGELESFLKEQVAERCILFPSAAIDVAVSDHEVIVQGSASNRTMSLSVKQSAVVTKPETYIRKKEGEKDRTKDKTGR